MLLGVGAVQRVLHFGGDYAIPHREELTARLTSFLRAPMESMAAIVTGTISTFSSKE
jgi:hypothetical protein